MLYRHCIKLKLTNGRNTYTMCFAVMSIVLEKFGVESDLRKIELDFEVDENLTHKYVKTINKNTKRFRV